MSSVVNWQHQHLDLGGGPIPVRFPEKDLGSKVPAAFCGVTPNDGRWPTLVTFPAEDLEAKLPGAFCDLALES